MLAEANANLWIVLGLRSCPGYILGTYRDGFSHQPCWTVPVRAEKNPADLTKRGAAKGGTVIKTNNREPPSCVLSSGVSFFGQVRALIACSRAKCTIHDNTKNEKCLPLSRRAVRREGPLHLPRVRHAETLLLFLARRRRRVGHSSLCENNRR